ncbi:DinB superfamily protein [compost metagenome]
MESFQRKLWSENHKKLSNCILNPNLHNSAVELFLNLHVQLYSSQMTNSQLITLEDELLHDISEETLRTYPVKTPGTINSIVWHLWHAARIEDMTMNILVHNDDQIFSSGDWFNQLKVDCAHSGNGMTEEEIGVLSTKIDIDALLAYRLEVGRKTREIISSLQPGQFKQPVNLARLQKLMEQGAVKQEESWLTEYWGKKTIAGLMLMPATRHNFVHLNKAIRIKQKYQKR